MNYRARAYVTMVRKWSSATSKETAERREEKIHFIWSQLTPGEQAWCRFELGSSSKIHQSLPSALP